LSRKFAVLRSRAAARDLGLILDHLFESYCALGDNPSEAFERASKRVESIEDDMDALGRAPCQGTLREDLLPGLRQVTKDRAIYCFVLDEETETLRVLAVFFGGQDHQRHMLKRLLAGD
jgi:toxin ParE1/3/4